MTKTMAENIAIAMTTKQEQNVTTKQHELKNYVTGLYINSLPEEITVMAREHPEFFKTCGEIRVGGTICPRK